MLVRGDQFYMAVCNKTGGIAIYNPDQNMFMSPLADGPLKFVDSLDGTSKNIEHVTKYGRSFSVVRVPYVFKLFMHELQAMNVKMAVITEDNIDQFDNMNFSKNISLLTHGKTIDEFVEDVQNANKPEQIKFSQGQYLSDDGDDDTYDPELLKPPSTNVSYDVPSDYDLPNDLPKEPSLLSSIPSPPASLQTTSSDSSASASDSSASASDSSASSSSGFGSGNRQFKVGDAVNFKGDYKQDRKWNIKEFEKGFAILETEDKEGLESNVKVAGLADIKPYVEPQIQIQPPHSPQQVPVVLNMYNVNGNENTLQPQPQVALQPQVDSQQQVQSEDALDFSQPKIKIKDSETEPNLIKGGTIVVKKI
jgi:hypothetical protein